MKKLYIVGLVALAAILIGLAWAEQITFSTYYPAPYGVYKEFTTTSKTTLATNPLGTDADAKVGIGTTSPGTYDTEDVNLDVGANSGEGYAAVDDVYLKSPKSGGDPDWASNMVGRFKQDNCYWTGWVNDSSSICSADYYVAGIEVSGVACGGDCVLSRAQCCQ